MLIGVGITQASILDLKVTEIMYHPKPDAGQLEEDLEFIEFKNTGTTNINMKSLVLSNAVLYSFDKDEILQPGEMLVLVSDSNVFHERYPLVKVAGQYSNKFSNGGEKLYVKAGFDTLIEFEYKDDLPWSTLADGNGYSLVSVEINPNGDPSKSEYWRNGSTVNGTPGEESAIVLEFPDVWINELLSHTDVPEVDAIELFNNSLTPADISNWFLSDSKSSPYKFQFSSGTIINPGEYLVVDETDFNTSGTGFRFNRSGDEVFLYSGDNQNNLTGFSTGWAFKGQYNGVTFGIHVSSDGDKHFLPQEENTLGFINSNPIIGPLVISEINYNPSNLDYEYLTIENITDTIVDCFHPKHSDLGWTISGVGFDFPANTTFKANELVFVTAADPTNFRLKYNINNTVEVFQYGGKMSNSGEELSVWRFDRMDTTETGETFMPKVLMDEVHYDDALPWDVFADGHGNALKRISITSFGNEVENWEGTPSFTSNIATKTISDLEFSLYYEKEIIYTSYFKGTLTIYDSNGKICKKEQIKMINGSFTLSGSDGVYFYLFVSEEGMQSGKLIKK
jgi:hypothetical protein